MDAQKVEDEMEGMRPRQSGANGQQGSKLEQTGIKGRRPIWNKSTALIFLRLSQLGRPLIFISMLRLYDTVSAAHFVHYISLFVITLEVFNIFYPTDRLYLSESRRIDLRFIIYKRILAAAFILPAAFLFYLIISKLSLSEATTLSALALIGCISVSFISYAYPRVQPRYIFKSELISISLFAASFAIFFLKWGYLLGFIVYYFEQVIKSAYLSRKSKLRISNELRNSFIVRYANVSGLSGIGEGLAVTLSNQIVRLPFVFFSGKIDPLYFIATQIPPALYNLLIAVRSSMKFHVGPLSCLSLIGLGFAGLFLIEVFLPVHLQVMANLVVLCGFAVIHGIQLIEVPGQFGAASDPVARAVLVGGMALVAACGLAFDVRAFLFAPMVLSMSGMTLAYCRSLR